MPAAPEDVMGEGSNCVRRQGMLMGDAEEDEAATVAREVGTPEIAKP